MDYGKILKEGWHITWKNRFLWWLGLIAYFGGNRVSGSINANGFNSFGSPSSSPISPGVSPSDIDNQFDELFRNFESGTYDSTLQSIAITIGVLVFCLVIFSIIMWFFRFAAEAAMIQGAFDVINGQESGFSRAFNQGRQFIIPMFGMRLIIISPLIFLGLLGIAGGITIAIQANNGANLDTFGPIFGCFAMLGVCLLFPYFIITTLLYPLAQRSMVLRGMGAMDSLYHSWDTFRANLGETLLFGVIFFAFSLGVGIVTAILVIPIILATGYPLFSALMSQNFDFTAVNSGLYYLLGIGIVAIIPIGAIVQSIAVSYRSATFTLAYIEFMDKAKLKVKSEPE